jgi:hypothetical protein
LSPNRFIEGALYFPAVAFLIGASATEKMVQIGASVTENAVRNAMDVYDAFSENDHPEHGEHDGAMLQAVGGNAVRHTLDDSARYSIVEDDETRHRAGVGTDRHDESHGVVHQLHQSILMPELVK